MQVDLGEIIKLLIRPRYSLMAWVSTLLILYFDLPSYLRLKPLIDDYGKYIGLVGVICFVVWGVEVVLFVWTFLVSLYRKNAQLNDKISGLNPEEKYFLATHLVKNQSTIRAGLKPEQASLTHKKILEKIETGDVFTTIFIVDADVWQYLIKNKGNFLDDTRKVNPNRQDPRKL